MLSGIREICIITAPAYTDQFKSLLGDGSRFGLRFTYIEQPSPDGLAQAYVLAEEFLDGGPSAMVLGDNIFHGSDLIQLLQAADQRKTGGTIFGYAVTNPSQYGVVSFDKAGVANSIAEKPANPQSNFAVIGLYFLNGDASHRARTVRHQRGVNSK